VNAADSVCAACGYELVVRRERIRCSHCGSRIPADAAVCPRCGVDPRARRFPHAARVGAIAIAALLLMCCGWVAIRAVTTNTLGRALGLDQPTTVPTQVVQVIYVVATPISPTPTLTPNPTATPTPRFSPTPTRRGARTATPVPTSAAVAPGAYAAPQLVSPLNATVYQGADSVITLQWQPVSPNGLRENEWYYITMAYTARDGTPGFRYGWSKETRWNVPSAAWNDAANDARTYKWYVAVMRIQGADPLMSPSKTPVSPNSATRTFIWH
jgi:hypothetical protein